MRAQKLQIVCAAVHGRSEAQLAFDHGLSVQRVSQIVSSVLRGFGMHLYLARKNPEQFMQRLRARAPVVFDTDTPEGFFYEMLREPRNVALATEPSTLHTVPVAHGAPQGELSEELPNPAHSS